MCRYNSGFFYKHPLLKDFDYYWRIEPDVDYYCELDYDPFLFMKYTGKKYGYNIIATEFMNTVDGLWDTIQKYIKQSKLLYPRYLNVFKDNDEYNGYHFW